MQCVMIRLALQSLRRAKRIISVCLVLILDGWCMYVKANSSHGKGQLIS